MSRTLPSPADLRGALRRGGAFIVVGLLGFVVDAGVYNLLVFAGGQGPMFRQPLAAKIIAIAVATVVTYVGNRFWTFRHRTGGTAAQRYVRYTVFNLIAIALQLACLGFSRYVLHLDSALADNVSGTLIGQIVAVVFRYWSYDKFVFVHAPSTDADSEPESLTDA